MLKEQIKEVLTRSQKIVEDLETICFKYENRNNELNFLLSHMV